MSRSKQMHALKGDLVLLLALALWGVWTARSTRSVAVMAANVGPAVGVQSVCYDGALGGVPAAQGQFVFASSGPTESWSDGATRVDTTFHNAHMAGWTHGPPAHLAPTLDRSAGYTLRFTVQITSEDHTSSGTADKDGDEVDDRAGFSVTALSSDSQGIDLGFWADRVWAQQDGVAEPPAGTLFTHAEEGLFDTSAGPTSYELTLYGSSYSLVVSSTEIVSGSLRDYTAFGAPYTASNFFFFGDNTTAANANFALSYVAIILNAAPPERSTAVNMPLAIDDLGVLDVDAGGNSVAVTMTVGSGALRVSESEPGGLTSGDLGGNGSSVVVLSGSIGQINATLASSPALTYTPNADFFGIDTLSTTVNDNGHSGSGGALSDSKGLHIHVLAADVRLFKSVTTPTAFAGDTIIYTLTFSNAGGAMATGIVITDEVPSQLNLTGCEPCGFVVNPPGLSIMATGSLSYVWQVENLSPGQGGAITITAQLSQVLSTGPFTNTATITTTAVQAITTNDTADVRLTVLNTAPAADDDAFDVFEDSGANALDVLAGDSDANADTLTVFVVGAPDWGGGALNAGTHVTYSPAADFIGAETFTYTVGDLNDGYDTATVVVSVSNVNDAPLASGDAYSTACETPLTVDAPGVLGDDADVDDDALTATLASGPFSGTLALDLDGSFVYTPTVGLSGLDGFVYVASDGALSDTATVIIGVGVVPAFTLTVSADGSGGGTVEPGEGQHVYELNTVVAMTATANADSTFVGWRGALDGTSSPVTLTMTRDMDVVASFELARFEVYLPLVLKD